jgi:hypothetical protein
MSASQGHCAKCNEINAYKATSCVTCGARLPWAGTIAKATMIAAAGTQATSTPSSESQGFGAFLTSPAFRYVVLGILLAVAAATYFVVDSMVSSQIAEAMSGNTPQTSQTEVSKSKSYYSGP